MTLGPMDTPDVAQLQVEHARYRQALVDMLDPVGRARRDLPPGYEVDVLNVLRWAEYPGYYQSLARQALEGK